MKFTLPGIPVPQQRHRTKRVKQMIWEYDPQAKEKDSKAWDLKTQMQDAFNSSNKATSMEASNLAFATAVSVEITFFMPFSASASNKRLNRFLWGLETMVEKPDLDNLEKFILDTAKGILFTDDKIVVELKSKKVYSLNPRTEIKVMPKKPMDIHETADAILQTLSPCEFHDLVEITHELSSFAACITQDTDLASLEQDPQLYRKRLTEAAGLISELAEKYAVYLASIKKKFPNFCDNVIDSKISLQEDDHAIS